MTTTRCIALPQGTGPVNCTTSNDTVALPGFLCADAFVLNKTAVPNTCEFVSCSTNHLRQGDKCICSEGMFGIWTLE
jgi:hypothetical protein